MLKTRLDNVSAAGFVLAVLVISIFLVIAPSQAEANSGCTFPTYNPSTGSSSSDNLTVSAGTYCFGVNGIFAERWTKWYVNGVWQSGQDDHSHLLSIPPYKDPTFEYTFSSGTTIEANVYSVNADTSWKWLEYHKWTITVGKPDLTRSSASINKTTVYPGDTLSVNLTVKNIGSIAANSGYVYFYWKKDSRSYTSSYKVGSDYYGSLGVNGTSAESFSYTVPTNASPGIYYFYYWVDATGTTAESSENNNKYYWTITVADPNVAPVASISSPTSPVTVDKGTSQSFTVSATDQNDNLKQVEWYYDGGDPVEIDNLSGGSGSASLNQTFSTGGTYLIEAVVQDTNWAYDTVSWTVNVIGATITITSISPNPVYAGGTATVSYTIDNTSDVAHSFGVGAEIRQGTTVVDDRSGYMTLSVPANSSYSGTFYFTDILSTLTSGTYTMRLAVWSGTPGSSTGLDSFDINFTVNEPAVNKPAEIISFSPPTGILQRGDQVTTTVTVKNTGNSTRSFWVGLSFAPTTVSGSDWPTGWYDIYPIQTSDVLLPGEEETVTFNFDIPDWLPPGKIKADTAVWDDYDRYRHRMLPEGLPFDAKRGVTAFSLEGYVEVNETILDLFSHESKITKTWSGTDGDTWNKYLHGDKMLIFISVSAFEVVSGTILIDAADYLGITPEGQGNQDEHEWVTVWIDGGLGVSYGVSPVVFGVKSHTFNEPATADVRQSITEELGSLNIGILGRRFTFLTVENGKPQFFESNRNFETQISLDIISGSAEGFLRYEISRSRLNQIFNTVLLSANGKIDLETASSPIIQLYSDIKTIIDGGINGLDFRIPATDDDGNWKPDTPTNVTPADGTIGISTEPVLWGSPFSDFDCDLSICIPYASHWQIDDVNDFSSPIYDSDQQIGTSAELPTGWLEYNTQYFWRVQYKDSIGAWSNWSIPTSFQTISLDQPLVPIIAPIENQTWQEGSTYTSPTPSLSQGTPVTWSPVNLPSGAYIDPGTGVVSWPYPTSVGSPHTITIRATNTAGYDDETWLLTVNSSTPASIDSYETDDTYSQANTISAGSPQSHSIDTAGDVDYVKFSATSGTIYTLETSGSTDTKLYLYSTNGTTQIDWDNDSGSGTNALIEWICTSSGTYYAKATGYSSSTTGSYTLSLTSSTSLPPVVSNPDPADGATVSAGSSGQLLRVTASGATSGTIYYDDDSAISFSTSATVNGDYLEATIPYESGKMKNNGTNYWFVEAANSAGTTRYPDSGNLSFTVTGTGTPSPPVVSNPDPADGATVSAGSSGQLLQVKAPGATSGTFYYDDYSAIGYAIDATLNGDYLEVTIPYESGKMNNNGTNYWFVEAANSAGTTRYPDSGILSFTVTGTAPDGGGGGGDVGGGGDSGIGCFIATAAYGSFLDPNVKVLRDFRDDHLLTNPAGRAFVEFYYSTSPPIADYIGNHESLRTATRWALTPVVFGIKHSAISLLLLGIAIGTAVYRKKKR